MERVHTCSFDAIRQNLLHASAIKTENQKRKGGEDIELIVQHNAMTAK